MKRLLTAAKATVTYAKRLVKRLDQAIEEGRCYHQNIRLGMNQNPLAFTETGRLICINCHQDVSMIKREIK